MECTARAWQHNHVPEEEDLSGYTVGGLMVVPGTQVHKVVEVFENHFGWSRVMPLNPTWGRISWTDFNSFRKLWVCAIVRNKCGCTHAFSSCHFMTVAARMTRTNFSRMHFKFYTVCMENPCESTGPLRLSEKVSAVHRFLHTNTFFLQYLENEPLNVLKLIVDINYG